MPELSEIVEEIQTASEQLAGRRASTRRPRLQGPPSTTALNKAVRAMPMPPPPSYLEFLRLHNGWEYFWSGFSIVGVSGAHTKAAQEDIKVSVDGEVFAQKLAYKADVKDKFARREQADPDFIYLPNHIIFATDFNGQLALFDRRTAGRDGEARVVLWAPDGIVGRHPSFASFLRAALADLRKQLRSRQ